MYRYIPIVVLSLDTFFRTREPWCLPAAAATVLSGAISTLAVQYTRAVLWVAPFIVARDLAQPVERNVPALVVCVCVSTQPCLVSRK